MSNHYLWEDESFSESKKLPDKYHKVRDILKRLKFILGLLFLTIIVLGSLIFYIMHWNDFRTVTSIKNVSNCSYYEMDYVSDYHFDDFLKVGATSDTELMHFILQKLLKGIPINIDPKQGFACSTFSITNTDGDYIFGRNLDWKSKTVPVLVHTKPQNGYESISLSNIKFMGGDCDLKFLQSM